jgi:hypothetical protein
MALTLLAAGALALATVPALLFLANLRDYRPPPAPPPGGPNVPVSVLIPARDEAHAIGPSVAAALASRGVAVEVVVLDDHSGDATASILAELAARDGGCGPWRARTSPPAGAASSSRAPGWPRRPGHPLLVFLDADVRLAPDGLARMAAFLDASGADLASGIPRQETGGLAERLVIPLIHFILLGFLPLRRMRAHPHPAYAAGCGQLFITRRDAYERAGGHAAIRTTLHDGIKLPRAYRLAGLQTDLFDATDVASCRMYRGAGPLWRGLAKNAGEALAAPALILPATLLLAGGQILPFALLACAPMLPRPGLVLAVLAAFAAHAPRLVAAVRFRQSVLGALLHPAGVALLLAIQWWAFARATLGRPATWKGRPYPAR